MLTFRRRGDAIDHAQRESVRTGFVYYVASNGRDQWDVLQSRERLANAPELAHSAKRQELRKTTYT